MYFHASGEDIKLCHSMMNHLRNLYQVSMCTIFRSMSWQWNILDIVFMEEKHLQKLLKPMQTIFISILLRK